MTKKEKVSPKYERVKDYVIAQIESSGIVHNDRIPSESELTRMLDVSSITVRKALTDLVSEGLIYRIKGKGSFVANPQVNTIHVVAFVIFGMESPDSSYLQIMQGVQSLLGKNNCRLMIEFVKNDIDQERERVMQLLQSEIQGLLIYSSDPDAAKGYLKDVRKGSLPFVMIDRVPLEYPVNCVVCNNHDSAYEGIEYLIEQGHRRIGFVALDFRLSSEIDRFNGYKSAMNHASAAIDEEWLYLDKELDFKRLIGQIREGEITALFCANDMRALEVLDRLTGEGIQVPEQCSLLGFDDFEASKFAKVPLTTVRQNFEMLGYEAAKLLLEIKGNPQRGCKRILLPTHLVIRETVAPLA